MPYLSIKFNSPYLPRPVCLTLRISDRVPGGSEALVSGTKVTRVRSPNFFVRHFPCLAFLPSVQLSFLSNFINCFPVMAGSSLREDITL